MDDQEFGRTHPARIHCPQCGSRRFSETGQIFALVPMSKTDWGTRLHPDGSIPVLSYQCNQCGHILLYSAKTLKRI
ncbi:hypothetical protein SAMN04488025_10284 [Planifilum fulgidum]|jgi:DNA-directed RNA polymerase subunit RPC12/RpoP|uniref:Uncharacterized protein n=2 Tax=Planifilum fulgidum TaxID=201973 RepID=A0A1I2KLB1_9BACL|nr:hypothetical protein [Bacillota bacterium]MBO2533939.1 hypothetical protein [Thermoactinomycetaceae bacterium]SFF67030.1 hypothetical protein SAMN04488025_10284 [Planifilum fulgidum]